MSLVDDAFQRLDVALAMLEGAVARRVEAEAARGDHEIELSLMEEDRARLAAELDVASARLAQVTATTGDVGRRLARAIDTVESVLDRSGRPI